MAFETPAVERKTERGGAIDKATRLETKGKSSLCFPSLAGQFRAGTAADTSCVWVSR